MPIHLTGGVWYDKRINDIELLILLKICVYEKIIIIAEQKQSFKDLFL